MIRTPPPGTGHLAIGILRACWMVSALWLIQARWAPPAGLPVPWLITGIPLGFWLWRLTAPVTGALRLAAVATAWLAFALVVINHHPLAGSAPGQSGWTGLDLGPLFQGHDGPNGSRLTLLAAAATWIGGWCLAVTPIGFARLLSEFQFGLLALLGSFGAAAQWGLRLPAAGRLALFFFTVALLAMALASVGGQGRWCRQSSRAPWIGTIVINTALGIGGGIALAAAVTPEILKLILDLLAALWQWVAGWVVRLIALLAVFLPQPQPMVFPAGGGYVPVAPDPAGFAKLLHIPDSVRRVAGWAVAGLWIVLLGLCLWQMAAWIAAWLQRRFGQTARGRIEPLEGAFGQDWRWLVNRMVRRLGGWLTRLRRFFGGKPAGTPLPAPAAALRRLYRELLAWSAARGCPRLPHQTPDEFLQRLGHWLPEARTELAGITDAYAKVRYGNRQIEAPMLKTLEQTWRDVRKRPESVKTRSGPNRST